jgi:hypothetical protein
MPCIWEQLQEYLVVMCGNLNILFDVRRGHELIMGADQMPLRDPQGQQRVGRGVLIPVWHGFGEAADYLVAGPTTDVPLHPCDEVRNTG